MSYIYCCYDRCVSYRPEKFDRKGLLRVILTKEKERKDGDFLFLNRAWNRIIFEKARCYEMEYDYIVFDDDFFLQSNLIYTQSKMFVKLPNGETCRKALKLLLRKAKDTEFLCVADDGTKSVVGSIYYALRELNLLKRRKSNNKLNFTTIYMDNYHSTSDTLYTRATHKLNYFDYFGEWDYIISPCLKADLQKPLIDKMEQESRKGYIIFGSFEKLKNLKYTRRVRVNKGVFIFVSKTKEKVSEFEIKSSKMHTNQLIDYLKKDIK